MSTLVCSPVKLSYYKRYETKFNIKRSTRGAMQGVL